MRTLPVWAFFFAIATALPAAALPPQLSALLEPASQEHHPGKVIVVELVTPDLQAAKRFYAGLFGWTYRDTKSGSDDYAEASMDGHLVAGLVQKPLVTGQRRQSVWLTFFAVRDVDSAAALAKQHGARLIAPPHDIANRGRAAVFADPQGAVFAVLASASGDAPDEMAEPGEWIWSSLSTTDPDTAAGFYQSLFDYEVFQLPPDEGDQHLMMAGDGYARASANPLPAGSTTARPHWLNYVHVEDVGRMAGRVRALGGRVLVEPRPDRHGGKVAIVADPLGAPFGLLEWPDALGKEVPR